MGKSNKDKKNTASRSYADSPVSHTSHAILEKISSLREKYPTTDSDTIDKLHAEKLVNFFETLIKKFHEGVLPEFDNYQKPGIFYIVTDLIGIRNLKEQLNTRKYALFLDVKKALPGIIQQLLKTPEKNMLAGIKEALTQDKDKLYQTASHIPGTSLDTLFTNIIEEMGTTFLSDNWNLNDSKQIDTLLFRLENRLFRADNKQAFTITHPMTFELAEYVIKLSSELPEQFQDLMPFLNPEAFITDLHSGLIGWGVQKLTGGFTYTSEHVKSTTDMPLYTYNVTKYSNNNPPTVTEYNCAVIVTDYITNYAKDFLAELQTYYRAYADTTHVKSELARSNLLQRFTQAEARFLSDATNSHAEACNLQVDFQQKNPVARIQAIDEELQRNQSLLEENNTLQQQLINKSQAWQSTPVSELLIAHPALTKELQDHTREKLTVTYSRLPLPDEVTGIKPNSDTVMLFGIKIALDKSITDNAVTLKGYNQQIQRNLADLAIRRQIVLTAWKQDVLNHAKEEAKKQSTLLASCQQELDNIDISSSPAIYGNIESLEKAIAISEQQLPKRQKLRAKVPALKTIEATYQLPPDASELDDDHSLQQALAETGKPVIQTCLSLTDHIESQEKAHQIGLYHLQSHLDKARSESVFEDCMRTLDLEKIRGIEANIETQIRLANDKNQEIMERLKTVEQDIAGQQSQLEALASQRNTSVDQAGECDKANTILLEPVLTFCTDQKLFTVCPQVTDLIKDQQMTCELLDGLMGSITQLHLQHAADQLTPAYYHKAIELLTKVSECLANGMKDSKIPFGQIEQLACVKQWNPQKTVNFNDILTILCQQSVIGDWNVFRSRQDDFGSLFNRPNKTEYSTKFEFLSQQIELKIADFTRLELDKKAGVELVTRLTDFGNTLPETREQVIQNFTNKTLQNQTIEGISLQSKETSESIESDQRLAEQQRQALVLLTADRTQLDLNQQVLSNIIEILEGIPDCKRKIESLTLNDKLSCTDKELYKTVADLQQTVKGLIVRKQEAFLISSSLQQANTIKSTLDALETLLASTQQAIAKTLRIKLNLNALELQHTRLENSYNEIQQEYTLLSNKPYFAINEITKLVKRLRVMSESLVEQNAMIATVKQGLSKIEDDEYPKKIEKIQSTNNTLRDNASHLGQLLMDQLLTKLNQWKMDTLVLNQIPGAEGMTYLTKNRSKIASIRSQFILQPDDEEIGRLAQAIGQCSDAMLAASKLNNIHLARENIEQYLNLNDSIDANISQRITERSDLVDTLLLPRLNAYLLARQEAYGTINEKREQLVNTLKLQLEDYKRSGDSHTVIKTIKDNMASVPGLKLQALLNTITIELIESDRNIPADYLNEQASLEPRLAHDHAFNIMKQFKRSHPQYFKAMCDVYNQVLHMKHVISDDDKAGQNYHQLADKLKYDLDRFVIAHPDTMPTKKAYKQFKDNFIARLHSEDDLNSVHRAAWKPIVLNVLIGLATLGIAIGVKALHSKLSTGRCTFFFNETRRQEHIALLDEMVSAPVAGAA